MDKDWMEIRIRAPEEIGMLFLAYARSVGFREVDWTIMRDHRTDAIFEYDPIPEVQDYWGPRYGN